MSASNPVGEVDRQIHQIFADLNDPVKKEAKRLEENKKKRAETIKLDLGL